MKNSFEIVFVFFFKSALTGAPHLGLQTSVISRNFHFLKTRHFNTLNLLADDKVKEDICEFRFHLTLLKNHRIASNKNKNSN